MSTARWATNVKTFSANPKCSHILLRRARAAVNVGSGAQMKGLVDVRVIDRRAVGRVPSKP